MTTNAIPVRRGCGERKQGGIYGECGLSPFGRPLEDFLLDPAPYVADQTRLCPKGLPDHAPSAQPAPHCAALWWEDVQGGEAVAGSADPRLLRRSLPSFRYDARRAPDGAAGRTTPAIFASFPLSRLVVIGDPEGNSHTAALERASQAQLPVELEEA